MAFPLFENAVDIGALASPDTQYRDMQQAFIDKQWDNTSAKIEVEEQDNFGELSFHKVEAWANKVIGQTSTFMKNGEDFAQLIFRDINKTTTRGLYYKIGGQTYIADFDNPFEGLVKDVTVRRCNNWMRIIDPENGAVFSIPCVIDYDMTSPTMLINQSILTPNSHAIVYVQANEDTIRLFRLNTRYMFAGRPFKLLAYQNTLLRGLDTEEDRVPPVLYLDLYLDELHARDDIANQLADNGEFDYSVAILSQNRSLAIGDTGVFEAQVKLNGEQVEREVVWESSNSEVVSIDDTGSYTVGGTVGDSATITAILEGNTEVQNSITIEVVEAGTNTEGVPVVYLSPGFDRIRQYETIEFEVKAEDSGNEEVTVQTSTVSLDANSEVLVNQYLVITKLDDNKYSLYCTKFTSDYQTIYITALDSRGYEAKTAITIQAMNMFG